jgi:hypothetical protein
MPKPPSRNSSSISRRKLLFSLGAGGLAYTSISSQAYTTGEVGRSSDIGSSEDPAGLLGLQITESVSRGSSNIPLVIVENNYNFDLSCTFTILGTSQNAASFSQTGGSTYTVTIPSGTTQDIRIDVVQQNTNVSVIEFSLDAESTAGEGVSVSLTRAETQIGSGSTDPATGEIDLVNGGQKGKSGKFTIEWATGGDTAQFSGVNIYVNGQLEIDGGAFSGSETFRLSSGDTVTGELIDNNGNVVDTDIVYL